MCPQLPFRDWVSVTSVDNLNLTRCDLLVIHTHNAIEVLEGASNIIATYHPTLCIRGRAVADTTARNVLQASVSKHADYSCHWIATALFNRKNYFSVQESIWEQDVTAVTLICIHTSRKLHIHDY